LRTNCPRLNSDRLSSADAALGFARFAVLWVVLKMFVVKEELLARREYKLGSAIDAR